ncbi:hypothetical protein D6D20_05235 [Aureobasidium pullulans]|uniref:Rhodopsin domain-containing protein n=1 Tax=Aureobasidium pullulans TaxID=5580 RepID=A0A4S8Z8S3_AURPU|nr:hypothetical protein D6D20_05235 [Aureobasidium pullulans]
MPTFILFLATLLSTYFWGSTGLLASIELNTTPIEALHCALLGALYAIATFIILGRYAVRLRTVGIKGLYWDDLFCFGVLIFNTSDAVLVHLVHYTGESSEVSEKWLQTATQADIDRVTYGSKLEYAAWCSYPALIWCMKFTMLFFYKRLTLGSFHNKMIKYLFWFTGVSYVIVWFVLIFGCFPTHMNWQVTPAPPWKCAFRPQNFLAVAIPNILTDAAILMVPIPMLWQLKMPLKKKITIGVVLSSGLFVIVAAIIRVVLSLDAAPSAANINGWGVRETFIGIFTINVPILRPIFSRAFWLPGAYDPNASGRGSGYGRSGHNLHSAPNKSYKGTKLSSEIDKSATVGEYELEGRTPVSDTFDIESNASTEKMVPTRSNHSQQYPYDVEDGVRVETSYAIRSTRRDEETGSMGGVWNSIGVPK